MANIGFPAPPQNTDEGAPLLGLYLDRPPWKIDPKGFSACNNVRIEQGRVRTDLMGWALYITLPEPVIYIGAFNTSFPYHGVPGGVQLAVTTTNIYQINDSGDVRYRTPCYQEGSAKVTNGVQTIAGINTRWASDIQCGGVYDQMSPTQTYPAGRTNLVIDKPPSYNWPAPGCVVTCLTNPGAIAAGTQLSRFLPATSSEGLQIVLSLPTTDTLTSSDVLQVGSGIALRPAVQIGDQFSFGIRGEDRLSATWYTVVSVADDTHIVVTPPYAGSTATNAYTIRQLLTDTTLTPTPYLPECSEATFQNAGGLWRGDNWFFTNGVDPLVQMYNEGYPSYGAAFGTPPSAFFCRSSPFRCAALTHNKSVLVCGGLSNIADTPVRAGMAIATSDNGLPATFNSGVAFQGDVGDSPSYIKRVSTLGDTLLIYATGPWQGGPHALSEAGGCVVSASFVGSPTIWAFSTVIEDRGPLSGNLVVEYPDRHDFLTIDGEYRYNGLFVQVMNDQVWRQVLKGFDASRSGQANAIVVPTYGDTLWAVPQLSDPPGQLYPSTAFVEHYMEQANSYVFKPMTQRDFPFTAVGAVQNGSAVSFDELPSDFNDYPQSFDAFGGLREQPPSFLAGDASGNIWNLYTNNTQNGTPAQCSVTWAARVIGNARQRALVTRVYPSFEAGVGTAGVTLTLRDALAGPVTITDTQSFALDYSGNRFTTHYRRGRIAAVTFTDTSGAGWVCDGYDFDWQGGGLR